jgi:hypothetical protein
MSRRGLQGPALAAAAAIAVAVGALGAAAGLSALSRPDDYDARLARLNAGIATLTKARTRAGGDGPTYSRGAICKGGTQSGAETVRALIRAGGAGLEVSELSFAAAPESEVPGLRATAFRFRAVGPYDKATGLLGAMAGAEPKIFADKADLVSQGAAVSLTFSGRFYCSTLAPT